MGHGNVKHVENVEWVFEDATSNTIIPDMPDNFLPKCNVSLTLALRVGGVSLQDRGIVRNSQFGLF
jgi:hypothetical protein